MIYSFITRNSFSYEKRLELVKDLLYDTEGIVANDMTIEGMQYQMLRLNKPRFYCDTIKVENTFDTKEAIKRIIEEFVKQNSLATFNLILFIEVPYGIDFVDVEELTIKYINQLNYLTKTRYITNDWDKPNTVTEQQERSNQKNPVTARNVNHKPGECTELIKGEDKCNCKSMNDIIQIPYETKKHKLEKANEFASGYDIRCDLEETIKANKFYASRVEEDQDGKYIILNSYGGRALICSGIRMALPIHLEAAVRPRSGLALKNGISIVNSPGTIDSDYRGDVGVILINRGFEDFIIRDGDRIAQLVIQPKVYTELYEGIVGDTARGANGFGSSGVK